jgi:plastocyanin
MKMWSRSLGLVGWLWLASAPVAHGAVATVNVIDFAFSPQMVTINEGDTVTWNNNTGVFAHNVVSDTNLFTSGALAVGPWTFSHTFTSVGTFPYYCASHGAPGGFGMSGTVVVQPSISIADRAVAEGDAGTAMAVFTLSLSAPSTNTVTVMYHTADGTATAGIDYTAVGPTMVTFPPGAIEQTVSVPVIGDVLSEDNETFFVNLSSPTNASIADGSAVGTILDDDAADLFTIAPCRVVNTRLPPGPGGGPALPANGTRVFPVTGVCGIPNDARAVALIVTTVNAGELGDLRLYPADAAVPAASTINFGAGRTRANNALIVLGTGGRIAVRNDMPLGSSATTNVLIDVSGYFKRK